jgi:hypothetical protein
MQAQAEALYAHMPVLTPAFLATPEAQRLVFRQAGFSTKAADQAALHHQSLFEHWMEGQVPISVLLGEAATHVRLGTSEIMARLLDHLADLPDWVSLRLVPFSAGPYPAMTSTFVIVQAPQATAYTVEGPGDSPVEWDPVAVEQAMAAFHHAEGLALSPDQTRSDLRAAARGYRHF